MTKSDDIEKLPLPKGWPAFVGKAIVATLSLLKAAFDIELGRRLDCDSRHAREHAELQRLRLDGGSDREMLRLLRARLRRLDPAKPTGKAEPNGKEAAKEKPKTDLTPLKKKAEEGKATSEKAKTEADALRTQAKGIEAAAKKAYAEAVAPYREACHKAGVECEYAGGRATNVTAAVRFLVERTKGGVKVAIKDRPETEEVIPDRALKESVSREAYAYTEKHIGPKSEIGNKGGGLANRIRTAFAKK